MKHSCTPSKERRITRWEHEPILEAVQRPLDQHPEKMRQRRETVEHPFGTLKGDDVIKGGVDQVMPLRGQRRLGPVMFDFVRPPKNLEVFLLAVAAYHSQERRDLASRGRRS